MTRYIYPGLEVGDLITEAAGQGGLFYKAREENDPEMMKAKIAEAYQYKMPLTVMRGTQSMTLAPGAHRPAGTNAPTTPDTSNSVQGQLDKITKQPR